MGVFTPDNNTLRELYTVQLKKALDMEKAIVDKGLPTMLEKATDPDLQEAFRAHLDESRQHVARLETILDEMEGEASEKNCKAIHALISEASDDISDAGDAQIRDVVLIAAGNQVEHHEIAVYGTLIAWAEALGEAGHQDRLMLTLEEEKKADALLTSLSEEINIEAPVA